MKFASFLHHPHKKPFGISVIISMLILNVIILTMVLFASFMVPVGEIAYWI